VAEAVAVAIELLLQMLVHPEALEVEAQEAQIMEQVRQVQTVSAEAVEAEAAAVRLVHQVKVLVLEEVE
jgi:hypothetical protein